MVQVSRIAPTLASWSLNRPLLVAPVLADFLGFTVAGAAPTAASGVVGGTLVNLTYASVVVGNAWANPSVPSALIYGGEPIAPGSGLVV